MSLQVNVQFPGNATPLAVFIDQISRDPPPPIPGGFKDGEIVFYCSADYTLYTGAPIESNAHGGVLLTHV